MDKARIFLLNRNARWKKYSMYIAKFTKAFRKISKTIYLNKPKNPKCLCWEPSEIDILTVTLCPEKCVLVNSGLHQYRRRKTPSYHLRSSINLHLYY